MRSPADMDIIVLDVINRCFLNCSNCTRLIAHQTKTREMTPDELRTALRSLVGWWKPGRVVGLIGGEPTLHKQFGELCRVMREEWNPGNDPDFGREPIEDFNDFAEQRLFDRTNGRGLWTSFGPKFMDHYEAVMDTFSHWNPNDHTAGGKHQTGLVDAEEMCESLGIPWTDWPKYRDNCWVQNTWSASVTPAGAYFCEYAGQLDLLYNEGRRAWPITSDWWQRKPSEFGEQLELCEMCSLCLPGPGQVDSLDRDIVGTKHRQRLEMVGSPAVKRGKIEAFGSQEETRVIDRKDSYTNGARVSPDNRFIRPKKVTAIVVCVGREEHLRQTVQHNAEQVDELVVVSDRMIADLPCRVVIVNPSHDHAFNKGIFINAGIRAASDADWIVLTDADCFLPAGLKDWVKSHSLNPGVIYGAQRSDVAFTEPSGYFQLFNRRASSLKDCWPNVASEKFCSAGGVDTFIMQRFPREKMVMTDLVVRHIPHGGTAQLWNGTRSKCWRQCGMLTINEFIAIEQVPENARLLLTCTKTERQWETQLKGHVLDCELEFTQDRHLHVAYWKE